MSLEPRPSSLPSCWSLIVAIGVLLGRFARVLAGPGPGRVRGVRRVSMHPYPPLRVDRLQATAWRQPWRIAALAATAPAPMLASTTVAMPRLVPGAPPAKLRMRLIRAST